MVYCKTKRNKHNNESAPEFISVDISTEKAMHWILDNRGKLSTELFGIALQNELENTQQYTFYEMCKAISDWIFAHDNGQAAESESRIAMARENYVYEKGTLTVNDSDFLDLANMLAEVEETISILRVGAAVWVILKNDDEDVEFRCFGIYFRFQNEREFPFDFYTSLESEIGEEILDGADIILRRKA